MYARGYLKTSIPPHTAVTEWSQDEIQDGPSVWYHQCWIPPLYVMDEGANDDKYKLFFLKNHEFFFDVDVSELM